MVYCEVNQGGELSVESVSKDMIGFQRILQVFKRWLRGISLQPALLIFLLNLFLISPLLYPSLIDFGPFDEMIHINTGRELLEGSPPKIPGHPLIALLYAIPYIFVKQSPYWFLRIATFGRLAMFCMMWWSAYLVAKQLSKHSPPLIMAGMLLVSPVLTDLFLNPPDALFAAMSGFSLWQFLRFYHTREIRYAVYTSILLGLATHARLDGLVVFPVFILLTIIIAYPLNKTIKQLSKLLAATFIPFLIIVFGYALLYGVATGDFQSDVTRYSYFAFESGHQAVYSPEEGIATVEAREDAGRVYGSPSDNRYSVLNAVLNNPQAYLERLKVILRGAPADLIEAYGKRSAALFFLFATFGAVYLARRETRWLLSAFLLWPLHLLAYFVVGLPNLAHYLRMPFFVVFALASIGLYRAVTEEDKPRQRLIVSILLIVLSLYGLLDNKLAIYAGASVFLLGLWLIWLVADRYQGTANMKNVGLVLAFCLGLIIRPQFPSPALRTLDDDSIEQAVLFMIEKLEVDSRVISYAPGMVLAARMTYVQVPSELRRVGSGEELYQWLIEDDIKAIYSTHLLRVNEPKVWSLIEDQLGGGLELVFKEDPGDHQIIFVQTPESQSQD
jgi:hypothetical protein